MMSSRGLVFEDTWTLFILVLSANPAQTMGHNCVPFVKSQFGCCFVVCSLAHGDAIGSELLDMINAPQAFEYHVTAELWLQLATCSEGFSGILRVNEVDHGIPFQQSGQSLQSNTLFVHRDDLWLWQFGAFQRAASHKAMSKEQEFVLFTKAARAI